jgi:hypothetical protein
MPYLGICQASIAKVFVAKEIFHFTLLSEREKSTFLALLAVKGQLPHLGYPYTLPHISDLLNKTVFASGGLGGRNADTG